MNILGDGIAGTEAKVRYLDADIVVVKPGQFVRCAITGDPIPIDELKYWSVDFQEAYRDADAALAGFERHQSAG